jgi:hypothetical protein
LVTSTWMAASCGAPCGATRRYLREPGTNANKVRRLGRRPQQGRLECNPAHCQQPCCTAVHTGNSCSQQQQAIIPFLCCPVHRPRACSLSIRHIGLEWMRWSCILHASEWWCASQACLLDDHALLSTTQQWVQAWIGWCTVRCTLTRLTHAKPISSPALRLFRWVVIVASQ